MAQGMPDHPVRSPPFQAGQREQLAPQGGEALLVSSIFCPKNVGVGIVLQTEPPLL